MKRRIKSSGKLRATVLAALMTAAAAAGGQSRVLAQDQPAAPAQDKRDDILAYHTKDEKGGTPEAGRTLFEQRCAICHRFGAIGKDVGPDLTTISSRFKKRDVLESVLWPSRVISDQYQAEMFELSDGTIVSGLIVRENATAILLRTGENPEKPIIVNKANVVNRAASVVSLMPEGLFDDLANAQVADLLAFVLAPPPDK
jgi:putative heme-binding domain-containing protein